MQEREESSVGGTVVEPLDGVEDAGGSVAAEAALARAHAKPERAAEVVEVRCVPPLHRLFEPVPGDQLAFADELLGLRNRLARVKPRAERVEVPVLGVGQRLLVRPAGTLDPELSAGGVHGHLGHEPERRRLAACDRHEALDAVPFAVVEKRV